MEKRPYTRWTPEKLMEVAKKYKTINEFHVRNPAAYMAAKRKGLFKGVTAHMTPRNWTKERIQAEAKSFQTRSDFARGAKSAYSAASRMRILDEVCAHMPRYSGKGKTRGPNARSKAKEAETKHAKSTAEMVGTLKNAG